MADQKIVLNIKTLNKLLKGFKEIPEIRIGIMGDDNARQDGLSNATIGAVHEFGLGLPVRSFLRHPLIDNMGTAIEENFDVKADAIAEGGNLDPIAQKIAMVAQEVVQRGFDTGGYGKWPAWITPGYNNNTGMILVDTQQLRNSITSAVIYDK